MKKNYIYESQQAEAYDTVEQVKEALFAPETLIATGTYDNESIETSIHEVNGTYYMGNNDMTEDCIVISKEKALEMIKIWYERDVTYPKNLPHITLTLTDKGAEFLENEGCDISRRATPEQIKKFTKEGELLGRFIYTGTTPEDVSEFYKIRGEYYKVFESGGGGVITKLSENSMKEELSSYFRATSNCRYNDMFFDITAKGEKLLEKEPHKNKSNIERA